MDPIRCAVRLLAGLLIAGLAAAPAAAQLDLGVIGKAAKTATDVATNVDAFTFSEEEELALGEAISLRIRARYGVAKDAAVTRYLSLVGSLVAAQSERPGLPWKWIVLDSSSVNAFAAPGGWIHITRGALAVIGSEAELAAVLAHEVGHVTRKHTLKAIQKSMGMEVAQDQADFGIGTPLFDAVADKAADAVLAGFGRAEEIESDETGVALAAAAGYQPAGLVRFLGSLAAMQQGSSSKAGLFRSHPETEERIKKAEKQIKKGGLEGGAWLEERYAARVPYEESSASTGGPAVAGARGMTEGDAPAASGESADSAAAVQPESGDASAGEGEQGATKPKKKFSLARLSDPFKKDETEESAEVSGAGAGRAVGEEEAEEGGAPKDTEMVVVKITAEELAAFRREGGLGEE